MSIAGDSTPDLAVPESVSFGQAVRVWAKIGLLSFGGPAGQIALMHKELVEQRRWIGEGRFLHALNYCMLLPGPEAQQLATYIGWLLHRTPGGLAAGLLFILPGVATVMALSALYARLRELPTVAAVFFGLKAAVLAIVIEAVLRIGRRALSHPLLVAVAALAFAALFVFKVPFPWVVLSAALVGAVGSRVAPASFAQDPAVKDTQETETLVDRLARRGELGHTQASAGRALATFGVCLLLWSSPLLALWLLFGLGSVWLEQGVFFSKLAVFTFGGAYAALSYVAQQAVERYGWLRPGEMLDGLGLAETTPGPLILVVQFVAFIGAYRQPGTLSPMTAGILGALVTVWVTFVPCFLWIFVGGPYIEALRGSRLLRGALSAITAAVVGVILNLSVWFGLHVLFRKVHEVTLGPAHLSLPVLATLDPGAALLSAVAMLAVFRFHLGLPKTLAGSAVLGILWRLRGC